MSFTDDFFKYVREDEYVKDSSEKSRIHKEYDDDKNRATELGKPWIKVVDLRIDEQNPRNGFFELDWNEIFIEMLLDSGITGESQEEIVDVWFKGVVEDLLNESGVDSPVNSGNVVNFLKQNF